MDKAPIASYTFTIRLDYPNRAGQLPCVVAAVARAGGELLAVDVVHAKANRITRDVTINASSDQHAEQVVDALVALPGVHVSHVSDRVFLHHLGGKLSIHSKVSVTTRDALSLVYTPGVARVAAAVAAHKDAVYGLTIKHNAVAVVSDGSAVLDLGNLGPEAALPVLEGKAILLKEFGRVDAYPICVKTDDVEEFVRTVKNIAPGFGGIILECVSAPRCFTIEEELRRQLDIPVFHDAQHGTAVVVLAALTNALKIINKKLRDVRILVLGAGAGGRAIVQILLEAGARNIVCCDSLGTIHKGRLPDFDPSKAWLAHHTNHEGLIGNVERAAIGREVMIGVSAPDAFSQRALSRMAPAPILFALANPRPEILPEIAVRRARVTATGRSEYPNQINNVLAFPGIFRGALDARASDINTPMKLAAARALASCVGSDELCEEYILPGMFNREVVRRVARAVTEAAVASGVARRKWN